MVRAQTAMLSAVLALAPISLFAWVTAARPATRPGAPGPVEARAFPSPVTGPGSEPHAATPPTRRPSAGPAPQERRFLIARVRSGARIVLRSQPDGRALARLGDRTEFGSPRALSVAAERGGWLAVRAPELGNGKVGWVRADPNSLELSRTGLSVVVDRSARRVELRDSGRTVIRAKAAVGRPGSRTPTGSFAVTDKLAGSRYGSYYGCCILALSGRQPNLPSGWPGGDRLAIHGTDAPWKVGRAVSAGCVYAGRRVLRSLMRRVPLGTPVTVRA